MNLPNKYTLRDDNIITNEDGYVVAEMWGNESPIAGHMLACAPEMYRLLDEINGAFYSRTSKKEWVELMNKTKPLLRKALGLK